MSTPFTDIEAAIKEGHFIQHELKKTAYLVCNDERDLFVITDDQYRREKWNGHTVLEIFHRGGCNENKRIHPKLTQPKPRRHQPRVPILYRRQLEIEKASGIQRNSGAV